MELWIPFAFGGLVGGVLGFLIGRHRASVRRQPPVAFSRPSPPPRPGPPPEVKRVALDEG